MSRKEFFRLFILLAPAVVNLLVNVIFVSASQDMLAMFTKTFSMAYILQVVIAFGGIHIISTEMDGRTPIYLLVLVVTLSYFMPLPQLFLVIVFSDYAVAKYVGKNDIMIALYITIVVLIKTLIYFDYYVISWIVSIGVLIYYIKVTFSLSFTRLINKYSLFAIFHMLVLQLPLFIKGNSQALTYTIVYSGSALLYSTINKYIYLDDLIGGKLNFKLFFMSIFIVTIAIFIYRDFSLIFLLVVFKSLTSQLYFIFKSIDSYRLLYPSILSIILFGIFKNQLLSYLVYDILILLYGLVYVKDVYSHTAKS